MAALQRRRDFHMVILDVVLPGVHGDDLLPMIRLLCNPMSWSLQPYVVEAATLCDAVLPGVHGDELHLRFGSSISRLHLA